MTTEAAPELNNLALRDELAAELEAHPDHKRLPLTDWYMAREAEDDALEERIKEQAARLLAHVQARRNARRYLYGQEFRRLVEADLAKDPRRKSVDYGYGRAGTRKTPGKLHFIDAEKLIAWAGENLPEAVKLEARKTPVVEWIKATGEVPPGVEWEPPQEKFFPATEPDRTIPSSEHGALETAHDDGTDEA